MAGGTVTIPATPSGASVTLGAFVALAGIDLSCLLKSIKTDAAADVKDATTLCETAGKRFEKGQLEHSISGEGFFRSSEIPAEDAHSMFRGALADRWSDKFLIVAKDGANAGYACEMFNVKQTKYEVDTVVNELLMATFEAKATATDTATGSVDGYILFGGRVDNSAGKVNNLAGGGEQDSFGGTTYTGASVDFNSNATGFYAQVHVTDGDDDVQIVIQHSANNSVWVDLAITAASVNTPQEIKAVSGTVNRYVRATIEPQTYASVVVGFRQGFTG